MKANKPILLVEDDEVDQMNVERAIKELKIINRLDLVENGEEGLSYLKKTDVLPCLILLDLNMPKMGGIDFLKHVKKNEKYKSIPTIVLTTSKEENDKVESYGLGVAGYIVKPVVYSSFVETMKVIDMYWTLCETPE